MSTHKTGPLTTSDATDRSDGSGMRRRREETVQLAYGAGPTSEVRARRDWTTTVGQGVILYHYTCPCDHHLGSILDDGLLRTTESHIGSDRPDVLPYGEHVGPDVVWLVKSKRPVDGRGLSVQAGFEGCDKTAVRFAVDLADAQRWPEWSKLQGINPRWRRAFEQHQYPDLWYVVERPIPKGEWVSVDFDRTRLQSKGD